MKHQINTAVKSTPSPIRIEGVLSDFDLKLHQSIIKQWNDRFCGSLRHKQTSFDTMVGYVNRLTVFLGKPFWLWQTLDVDRWFGHIGKTDHLALSTQRIIQSNIASLFTFACEQAILNDVKRLTGVHLHQIVTKDIRMPHKNVHEGKNPRTAMSGDHLERFFATMDEGIERAEIFHSNDLKTRMRNKAMLFTTYDLGLRSAETCGLTTRSFEPRDDRPELGDYAFFHIFGKGDKYRTVHSLDPLLTDVLNWYMADVRPLFTSIKTANVNALFLSERGLPISDDQLRRAFNQIIEEAGLTEFGYTLHCLRHTYVTDAETLIGLGAVKDQVGHVFLSTTEGYYKKDPKSIATSINNCIDKTINLRKTKE